MEIIPAIDLSEGKCVRLSQGDYERKIMYSEDPLEVARRFEDAGIRRLHLVDLDGAKAQHIVNYKVLEIIASKTNLVIDFGGGLKSDQDLEIAFNSGASMITGGSIAVKKREIFLSWLEKYGPEKIILGADAKDRKIAVSGWTEATELPIIDFIKSYSEKGVKKVISTDIDRDGMLSGPSFELYQELLNEFPGIEIIASGGIASMGDIQKFGQMNIAGVIVGKAVYEGKISLAEIGSYCQRFYTKGEKD